MDAVVIESISLSDNRILHLETDAFPIDPRKHHDYLGNITGFGRCIHFSDDTGIQDSSKYTIFPPGIQHLLHTSAFVMGFIVNNSGDSFRSFRITSATPQEDIQTADIIYYVKEVSYISEYYKLYQEAQEDPSQVMDIIGAQIPKKICAALILIAEAEMNELMAYFCGNVYCWALHDHDGNVIDSCGGYYELDGITLLDLVDSFPSDIAEEVKSHYARKVV